MKKNQPKKRDKITIKGKQKLSFNIKQQLDVCGLTQRQFAKECNMSEQTISHIIAGRISPTLGNILIMKDVFNSHCAYKMTLDKLLRGVKYKK